jgi:hypothetical protein
LVRFCRVSGGGLGGLPWGAGRGAGAGLARTRNAAGCRVRVIVSPKKERRVEVWQAKPLISRG